jgi:hypothetical protein
MGRDILDLVFHWNANGTTPPEPPEATDTWTATHRGQTWIATNRQETWAPTDRSPRQRPTQ